MKYDQTHSNRQSYNWLIYDIGYYWLNRFKAYYTGHLYDLGCGDMPYKNAILSYVDQYTGVDWGSSPHELRADILADLNELLPIDDQVADTVLSLSVMEHLREPQIFLGEAFRILKPGGRIILQVPFMWHIHEEPHDYFRYTRFGLQYLLEKSGFSEIMIYPQTGFWVMLIMKFNYQSRRLIRGPFLFKVLISFFLQCIWAVDQRIAPWLDKYWACENEAAGYFVLAKKI